MSEASETTETARGRGRLRLALASPAEVRREHWERLAAVPLALAAIAFLVAYAVPIVWPGVDHTLQRVCTVVVQVVWLSLLVDYVVRFVLARAKRRFVFHHLLDLVVLALPMVRQLQLLRLVALFSILDRVGVRTFRGRVLTYAVAASALSFLIASLALTSTERGATGATIENFGDGMWFSIATLTTVGYGDMYPVTTQGRVIAAALMMVGLVLFGTVTGTLASYVVSKVSGESAPSGQAAGASAPSPAEGSRVSGVEAAGDAGGGMGTGIGTEADAEDAATETDTQADTDTDTDTETDTDTDTEADADPAADAAADDLVRTGRAAWGDSRRRRALTTLLAAGAHVAIVWFAALAVFAQFGGVHATVALVALTAGEAIMLPLTLMTAWGTFRHRAPNPRWLHWAPGAMIAILVATLTVVLFDTETDTAVLAVMSITWAFVGAVPLAMAYAQTMPARTDIP
ncbi:potassium channel family protein [Serinibacter salmoneus]|nr:potassium channel family protein [Serinibacter salmoneus]